MLFGSVKYIVFIDSVDMYNNLIKYRGNHKIVKKRKKTV